MTTKAGAGHLGPLIPFARAFQRAGADVLVAAPREAAPMVRAERLPLWAFDDPPAQERAAIFAEVRDQPSDAGQHGRVAGDIFVRIDARAAFPGVLAACRAWNPDLVISEITEFAGPLAAEVIGVPSIAVGISQQGKEERVTSVVVTAVEELRGSFGLASDPGGERLLRRPYFTLIPAARLAENQLRPASSIIGALLAQGTEPLLAEVKKRGFRLVLASSGKSRHVETFLDLFGGRDLADAWTTSEDAETSKPAPDIVQAALDRVRGATGVMIGDSTWDCLAAGKLDVPTLAVRTGGFSTEELGEAGALGVYDSLEELLSDLDNTPLRAAVSPG